MLGLLLESTPKLTLPTNLTLTRDGISQTCSLELETQYRKATFIPVLSGIRSLFPCRRRLKLTVPHRDQLRIVACEVDVTAESATFCVVAPPRLQRGCHWFESGIAHHFS